MILNLQPANPAHHFVAMHGQHLSTNAVAQLGVRENLWGDVWTAGYRDYLFWKVTNAQFSSADAVINVLCFTLAVVMDFNCVLKRGVIKLEERLQGYFQFTEGPSSSVI